MVAAIVILAAPAAFGAALMPVWKALGAQHAHSCACGMRQGDCGCPECARLDREHRLGEAPTRAPSLKSHCGDDAAGFAFVPAGVPSPTFTAVPGPPSERVALARPMRLPASAGRAPPTPPPRPIAA